MDNAEYGRSDYNCIYARTIPSIEYVVAYGYGSSPVAYCTPPVGIRLYAVYGTARSPT
jgi:hypothetical protein